MRILVIGDSCTDVFVYGKVDRLCPDAPVPIIIPSHIVETGGMAANVYENITSLGIDADLVTNQTKITKTRYIDAQTNHMFVRVDSERHPIKRISCLNDVEYDIYDAIIVSDYDKGFLHSEDIEFICSKHNLVFVDTKKIINESILKATFIKINEVEYQKNKNFGLNCDLYPTKFIITLGSRGCNYNNKLYPVKPVEVKDMSGAGDTFIATLALKYVVTKNIESSIQYANDSSTLVVQHRGVTKIGNIKKND